MSIEHQVGRLLAIAESNDDRLSRIEEKLDSKVDKVDFNREVAEHAVLHSRINEVKEAQDKTSWISSIAEKALYTIVTLLIGAVAAFIGWK